MYREQGLPLVARGPCPAMYSVGLTVFVLIELVPGI